jgi:hypothetical protein
MIHDEGMYPWLFIVTDHRVDFHILEVLQRFKVDMAAVCWGRYFNPLFRKRFNAE